MSLHAGGNKILDALSKVRADIEEAIRVLGVVDEAQSFTMEDGSFLADRLRATLAQLDTLAAPCIIAGDLPALQPLSLNQEGAQKVLRFRGNVLVRFLLDQASVGRKCDLNDLACVPAPVHDAEQLAMLIDYSLSGFADLSYVRDETYDRAEALAATVPKGSEPAA